MGGGPDTNSSSASSLVSTRSSEDAVEITHNPAAANPWAEEGEAARAVDEQSTFGGATKASSSAGSEDGRPRMDTTNGLLQREVDQDGVEMARLLYSKSKVYLHPTAYLRDNIPGFIAIVEAGPNNYLLAWIPEASIEGTPDMEAFVLVELSVPGSHATLVTLPPPSSAHAFSIPIRNLYSLIIQPPTLSSWFGSITFNLFDADLDGETKTLPPLYFHDEESRSTVIDRDRRAQSLGIASRGSSSTTPAPPPMSPSWGGEALLSQLRQYSKVVRSQIEPQLFLINPSKADREVHETMLFDDEAVPLQARIGVRGTTNTANGAGLNGARTSILHQSFDAATRGGGGGTGRRSSEVEFPDDVPNAAVGDFAFSVLNSFSRITRGARSAAQRTAQSVLSHPLAKPLVKHIPEPIAHFANVPGELTRLEEIAGVGGYDSARVYLARWAQTVAEEGERARRAEIVFRGPGGTEEDSEVGAFEVLAATYGVTRSKSTRAYATPIVVTEWSAWFDDSGRLMLPEEEAKKRIFQRGLAYDVRKDVWGFLLKLYPWTSSTAERLSIREQKTLEYERLKTIWFDNAELKATTTYIEESHRIEIDCRRTDRTHPMFANTFGEPTEDGIDESGHPASNMHVKQCQDILTTYVFAEEGRDYVQGMSDLLSPIFVVADTDEVLAYWCFVELMERQKGNFLRDQSGMKSQLAALAQLLAVMDPQLHKHLARTGALNLFFSFRWILCCFKRELSFNDTLALWEVLWTDHLGPNFHLFVALAIMEAHRDVIIRYLREFDEILKYVNELSQTLDIDTILVDAEVLCRTFAKVVETMDKKEAARLGGSSAEGLRRRLPTSTGEEDEGKDGDDSSEKQNSVSKSPEIEEGLRALLI